MIGTVLKCTTGRPFGLPTVDHHALSNRSSLQTHRTNQATRFGHRPVTDRRNRHRRAQRAGGRRGPRSRGHAGRGRGHPALRGRCPQGRHAMGRRPRQGIEGMGGPGGGEDRQEGRRHRRDDPRLPHRRQPRRHAHHQDDARPRAGLARWQVAYRRRQPDQGRRRIGEGEAAPQGAAPGREGRHCPGVARLRQEGRGPGSRHARFRGRECHAAMEGRPAGAPTRRHHRPLRGCGARRRPDRRGDPDRVRAVRRDPGAAGRRLLLHPPRPGQGAQGQGQEGRVRRVHRRQDGRGAGHDARAGHVGRDRRQDVR